MTTENKETPQEAVLGAVVYTDGSCRNQNPGFIGWGVHGYIYKASELEKCFLAEGHEITNHGYLKPAKSLNPGVQYVEPIEYLDFFGSSLNIGTNNQAELAALCHSLERLSESNLRVIRVFTDSEYLRKNLVDNCKTWEQYNWRKQDGSFIANHEWWARIYSKYKELRQQGIEVDVLWVRGHNDIFGNTHADILAGIGANYSMDKVLKNEFKHSPAQGYWKQEIDRHPFLNFKRIYFNSVKNYNTLGHYFGADAAGTDTVIGKRVPETGFAIVRLNEQEAPIEAVKSKQYEVARDFNAIIMMKLDRVYSKEVYPYLSEHGKYCLIGNRQNLNVSFFDKKPVSVEMNPTGLSMRALDCFTLLEDLLDRFMTYRDSGFNRPDNTDHLNAHDITDVFFDREEKQIKKETVIKYVLKPNFVVGFRDLDVEIEEKYEGTNHALKVPLILGVDLLPRNNLKKLEDVRPSIYLVTWRESKNSIRYATIIECDTGVGIWSNYFADRIFFQKTV